MNKAGGFIALHRQIQDWEWYSDANTFCLFVHLLLMANYVDGRFKGRDIKRGQLVTSLQSLATKTGLTIRQARTALEHLISTNEVTKVSTPEYTVITIVKYDDYQTPTNLTTNNRQATDKRIDKRPTSESTSDRQRYNNNNNTNKEINKQSNNTHSRSWTDRFEEFWSAYPRKEGKENARKAFAKLNPDDELLADMIIAVGKQRASQQWQESGGRFIPYPASWLNGHRWEDEIRPAAEQPRREQKKTVNAQQYEQRDYGSEDDDAMLRMLQMGGYR